MIIGNHPSARCVDKLYLHSTSCTCITTGENIEETMTTGPWNGFVIANNSLYTNSLQTYKTQSRVIGLLPGLSVDFVTSRISL